MRQNLSLAAILLLILLAVWMSFATIASPILKWSESASWESRPVKLDSAEYIRIGSKGSHKLVVKYRYDWSGADYVNDRISIYPPSISIPKELQRNLLQKISDEGAAGTLRAHVNLDFPAEAVLIRDFYPDWYVDNIFRLSLTLYWLFGFGWVIDRYGSKKEPIPTRSNQWKFIGYFAGFFTLIGIAAILMVVRNVGKGDYVSLVFLIFPAAAIALLWITMKVRSRGAFEAAETEALLSE